MQRKKYQLMLIRGSGVLVYPLLFSSEMQNAPLLQKKKIKAS